MPALVPGYHAVEVVAIEEGWFAEGKWVLRRIWNGDEAYHAVLPHEGVILRIKLRRS
jgi:hypothetical protein